LNDTVFNRPLPGLVLFCLAVAAGPVCAADTIPATPAVEKIHVDGSSALVLGFDRLADFPYVVQDAPPGATKPTNIRDQIPAWIHGCDGKRVTVTGYLIPITIDDFRTKQFVLVRSPAVCCYGVTPNINEFVLVTMKKDGVPPTMDVPVTVVGTLKVGESYENGYLVGIYQLAGEKMLSSDQTESALTLAGK
jgi:hypothetical protein